MTLKGDQATSRAINTRMLLNIMLRTGPVSRRDLAQETRLSPGTVTALVQDLISDGLVREMEAGKSNGGRRPIPLEICYDARLSIGIKLSEIGVIGVLTDLAATEIATAQRKFVDPGVEEIAIHIADIVMELVPDALDRSRRLIGVGIALPGFVDVMRGTVSSESRILRSHVPFASIISQRIGLPVWIDNDVNAYTIAHRRFGLARGKQTVLAVVLGTGLGAGLVVNGKVHRGAFSRAGEIGFSPSLLADGKEKSLGEVYTTSSLSSAWAKLALPFPDVFSAIGQRDKTTKDFLERKGREIGRQIAIMVQMIDPDTTVIGGETLNFGPDYIDSIRTALESNLLFPHGNIEFDTQNNLWSRGAAALAIDHFFDFENSAGHIAADSDAP